MSDTQLIEYEGFTVSASDEEVDYLDQRRWRKLDSEASFEIVGLLQAIPMAATAFAMSKTYKVFFPKGLPGTMLKKLNGHYQPTKVNAQHRFVENAELVKMNKELVAYTVFSVLSIATQQYYLHEIYHQLSDVQKKLDEVLEFLYTDKACELFAEMQAVISVYQNFASIMRHPEQRIVALQTIQNAKILAERNTQFYIRDILRLSVSIGKEDITDDLRERLKSYTQTVRLYGVCSEMEIMLSQNFDDSYLGYIEKDLKQHYDKCNADISNVKGRVELAENNARGGKPGFLGIGVVVDAKAVNKINDLKGDITELMGEQSPVKGFQDTVQSIKELYSRPAEYHITEGGEVYQRI
ncbi:MAG: hypothetical protein IJK28_03500 [Clostridia bacterium]|nr:hypothetical protein [Clostridia bacterium]